MYSLRLKISVVLEFKIYPKISVVLAFQYNYISSSTPPRFMCTLHFFTSP